MGQERPFEAGPSHAWPMCQRVEERSGAMDVGSL